MTTRASVFKPYKDDFLWPFCLQIFYFLDITLSVDDPTLCAVFESFLFLRKNRFLLDDICIWRSRAGYHYVEIRHAYFWKLTSFCGMSWHIHVRNYLHDFLPFHLAGMNPFLCKIGARRHENKERYVVLKRGNGLWSLGRIMWKWIWKKTENDNIEYNSKLTLKNGYEVWKQSLNISYICCFISINRKLEDASNVKQKYG
jgi:hypothetical protein